MAVIIPLLPTAVPMFSATHFGHEVDDDSSKEGEEQTSHYPVIVNTILMLILWRISIIDLLWEYRQK